MKKLLVGLLLISTISSAFSQSCIEMYGRKDESRRDLNVSAASGVGIGVFTLVPFGVGLPIVIGGIIANLAFEHDYISYSTQFETIKGALAQSERNELESEDFKKVATKIKRKAFAEHNLILTDTQISYYLNLANQNQYLCPVVKIKRDGQPKRAVLNMSALVKYISDYASTKEAN